VVQVTNVWQVASGKSAHDAAAGEAPRRHSRRDAGAIRSGATRWGLCHRVGHTFLLQWSEVLTVFVA